MRAEAEPATFVDLLGARADERGEAPLYRFLENGEVDGPIRTLGYAGLDRRARAIGARLVAEGAGARVLLLYPPGLDFVAAFFGCLYGGLIAVPAYPPDPSRFLRLLPRLVAITRDSGATVVLTTAEIAGMATALAALAPELAGLTWIATDTLADDAADGWRRPDVGGGSIAFLQYTSGSTGTPKGVMVTHANLLHNSREIRRAAEHSADSVYVSWLPCYHDMGLIGGVLQPLFGGFAGVLLSPMSFLSRPLRWLRAITHFRGTASPFPNFALDLCVRKIPPADRAGLDLRSWRVACNGAEPIRAESLARFTEVFGPHGFRHAAHFPAYGLAEATLIVAGGPIDAPPRLVVVDRAALGEGRVALGGDTDPRILVGCGACIEGQEIAIVDPATAQRRPPARVGEIWVRGPSVAAGYWNQPEQTRATFHAFVAGADPSEGPFLRTGDLGFVRDGELFVTGRCKDLLILRGRNHYPQDLEATAEQAHSAVRPGSIAAFSVEEDGEERLAIVAEVDLARERTEPGAVVRAIRERILGEHEVRAARIVLLPPGRIPKTSSGKIQRRACREELLAGRLEAIPVPPEPGAGSLYPRLDAYADRLDARGTQYRFALEDVAWDRLEAPGDYLPPALAETFGIDVDALRGVSGAWEAFQFAAALGTCDSFIGLEESLLRFVRTERAALGDRRSLVLLVEEEEKHVALFRRYAAHLRAARPDLVEAYDRHVLPKTRRVTVEDRARYEDDAAHHYITWVGILFFEEYTVWLHNRLSEERAAVQPAWYSAHAAHAREEIQHVATDHAWIQALAATAARRAGWSHRLHAELAHPFAGPMAGMLALCAERFPVLDGRLLRRGIQQGAVMRALLSDRAFRRTREAAPDFFTPPQPGPLRAVEGRSVAHAATAREIQAWVCDWVGARHGSVQVVPTATFVALGLDSVEAISLSGDLEAWLGCRLSATLAYDCPTPARVAETVAAGIAHLPVARAAPTAPATSGPASARQARLFHLDRAFPGAVLDHLTYVYAVDGPLDLDALVDALRALVARHPSLRTVFRDAPGGVEQVVDGAATVDLLVRGPGAGDEAARRAAELDATPYAIDRGPLLRVELVRAGPERHELVLGMHHIAGDGWSMSVLGSDLASLYDARVGAPPRPLPALGTTALEVAAQEEALLASDEGARRLAWWRSRLAHHPLLARPGRGPAFLGGSVRRVIAPETLARWNGIAAGRGGTLFPTLLAALSLVLRERSGADDVLVCTHLFDRPSAARKALVGYLVNLLTLRIDLAGARDLATATERARSEWLAAVAHELPVDHLVRELWPDRYASRWMPSPIAFNLLPWEAADPRGERIQLKRVVEATPTPSFLFFDQMLIAQPEGDGLAFTLWYDRAAIAEADANALVDGVIRTLEPGPEERSA